MNVTTPIATPVATTVDAAASPGAGDTAVESEFSDALAGFLTDAPTQGDADAAASDSDQTATGANAAASLPTTAAIPLPAAVALGYALAPAPTVVAAASVSLAQDAVAGPTETLPTTPAAPSAGAVTSPESAAQIAPALAGVLPGALGVATSGDASNASPVQPASNPAATAAAPAGAPAVAPAVASGDVETVDAQAAARALGLTLTTPGTAQGTSAADAPTSGAEASASPLAVTDAPQTATPAAPAPPVGSSATTATAQAIPAPAPTAPRPVHVAHQFATQLAALTGAPNGVHTMTIQITPDDLGPVQVQVTLNDGAVDMTVLTALEVGRDTIAQAAPDLRRYLEAAGLTCNSVEVDLNNDQSSWLTQPDAEQGFEERQPSNGREQAGTPSGDIDEPHPAPVATRSPSSTSTGVDLQM